MDLEKYGSVKRWLRDIAFERSGSLNTRRPYLRSEWKEYIEKENLTQGQYYNFYNRLLGAGLIRTDRGQVYDSEEFTTFLSTKMAIWNAWRAT